MTALLIAVCVLLEIAREILFKVGASGNKRHGIIIFGIILWAIEVLIWIRVLQLAPLSIAFPFMSLCYVGLPLASRLLLKETISRRQWLGIALITFGVACVGLSGLG